MRRKLRIWSHLQNNSLMENFIFCAVYHGEDDPTNPPVFDNRPVRSI